ncbi:MAG: hypothetical protein JXA30_04505 [Deltaproteobacteria bacterium]|nr:hypothetical protein [Deltaproteobacteria bacterium]
MACSLAVLTISACGSSTESSQPLVRAPLEKQPTEAVESPPFDRRRMLSVDSRFGDLIKTVNSLDRQDLHHSDQRCLLRHSAVTPGNWLLEADLAVAVRPLPEAPAELSRRLESVTGKIHLLTLWGRIGTEVGGIVLVAFTTTSPSSARLPAVALFLTERGVYLRHSDQDAEPTMQLLQLEDVGPSLAKIASQKAFTLYVTADAATPISALYDLLQRLPYPRHEVALAVALAAETRLPAPLAAETDSEVWCPDGLPLLLEDLPEGDMPRADIVAAIAAIRGKTQACVSSADASAAAGGRVVVAFRVGASGKVENRCLVEDDIKNLALAKCILSTLDELRLPPPNPTGPVDIHLPLRLSPEGISGQRPVCE